MVLLAMASGVVACASTQTRLSKAPHQSCVEALGEYPELSHRPDYGSLVERRRYEAFIAGCMVDAHRAEEALRLVDGLRQPVLRPQVLRVVARASATLGKDDDVHAALDELATFGPITSTEFWADEVFRPYRANDWFIFDALTTWSPDAELPLERYVERLVRHADEDLLPLQVAVADPQQGAGPWAVWMGRIREARIDRAANTTSLVVEGVDVKRQLIHVDRELVKLKWHASSWNFVRSGSFGGGRTIDAEREGEATFDPKYDVTETYMESFNPNGLEFVIEFPQASADLVQALTIQAIGRYGGRDPSGKPVLKASLVAKRTEARTDVNLGTDH